MTTYAVLFLIKMSAKDQKELTKKANKLGEQLSKHLHKTVSPYQYALINKKDNVLKDYEQINSVQQTL